MQHSNGVVVASRRCVAVINVAIGVGGGNGVGFLEPAAGVGEVALVASDVVLEALASGGGLGLGRGDGRGVDLGLGGCCGGGITSGGRRIDRSVAGHGDQGAEAREGKPNLIP